MLKEKNKINSYKDLLIWQKSMSFVEEVYKITQTFPSHETYGLISQIKRAAISIPTNICEGEQRQYLKEYVQFLYIAKSSASETETLLNISQRLDYIDVTSYNEIHSQLIEIKKMTQSLINKLKRNLK